MSATTKIEWTDATWNPVRGCVKISPGCKHCYAETFAERFRNVQGHIGEKWSAKMVPSPTASNNRGARARARIKDRIVLRKSRGLRLGVQYPVSGSPKHGDFGLYLTEVLMSKNALAILLAALMVLPLQGAQQTSPTVQKQVGQIAKGSNIEVKMKPKKMNKVTGRLGEVTAEGFEVQVAQGQKVDNIKLRFADVKSVAEKTQHKKSHPAVWVLAGVGAALLVVVIIGAVVATGF